MAVLRTFASFVADSARLVLKGGRLYYAWIAFLLVLIAVGAVAYTGQLREGLIATHMRDQVSWGF